MSLDNFFCKICILCHNDSAWPVQQSQKLTQSNISNCLKYIPQDINQTVDWKQLDENPCLYFCNFCNESVGKLSKLNDDLEEIQRKIIELVSCIVLHVKRQRQEQDFNSVPINTTSLDCNLHDKSAVVPTDPDKEQCEPIHQNGTNPNDVTSLDENLQSDEEFLNSDFNEAGKSDEEERPTLQSPDNSSIKRKEATKTKSSFQRQSEINSGYKCLTCHKTFSRYTILKKHDCDKPTVECETCGISFSSSGVLKLHTRSHTGEKPYNCDTCGKCFSIRANLRQHIRLHTGEKPFECGICGKKFSDAGKMSKHKKTHGNKIPQFSCDICTESFTNLYKLKVHLLIHSKGTSHPYKCDICDSTFTLPKTLDRHNRRVHLGMVQKPCQCELCGKCFERNGQLEKHKRTHSGEKSFQCSYCGKGFASKSYLNSHELLHTDAGVFTCDSCGKSYKNSFSLKIHMQHHKDNVQIPCEICGKLIMKYRMKNHKIVIHDKGKPFKCVICGTGFASRNSLTKHSQRYCHICDKSFHWPKTALLDHQIQVHTVPTVAESPTSTSVSVNLNTESVLQRSLPIRECPRKSTRIIEHESSSSAEDDDSASEKSEDEEIKVEVKVEDEFSEIEDFEF